MKRILFLSGKGGTGKTTIAGAFAALSEERVLGDCDVDAANLHLLLDPEEIEEGRYQGSQEAVRAEERCMRCERCREVCRFHAIAEDLSIDPYLCEGCGACVTACPADALRLEQRESGRWYTARTRLGLLASAELFPGEETSGKLVSVVKAKVDALAAAQGVPTALLDGSPGIGCPVIASVSGVQAVVLVTEPTRSGLHDLERALGLVRHFGVRAYLVINKADLSEPLARRIERFAAGVGLPVLGRIPYDERVVTEMVAGRSAVEKVDSEAGRAIRRVFERFCEEERRSEEG